MRITTRQIGFFALCASGTFCFFFWRLSTLGRDCLTTAVCMWLPGFQRLSCHDLITPVANLFSAYLNNARKPTDHVSTLCSCFCLLLQITVRLKAGGSVFLWQLLHLQMSDTSHGLLLDFAECGLDFTCELLSPPWGPIMFPLSAELLHSSLLMHATLCHSHYDLYWWYKEQMRLLFGVCFSTKRKCN